MQIHDLRQRLRAAGAGPLHEQRVLRWWAHAMPQDSGRRPMHFFPLALRNALPGIEADLEALARLRSVHAASDGSEHLPLPVTPVTTTPFRRTKELGYEAGAQVFHGIDARI